MGIFVKGNNASILPDVRSIPGTGEHRILDRPLLVTVVVVASGSSRKIPSRPTTSSFGRHPWTGQGTPDLSRKVYFTIKSPEDFLFLHSRTHGVRVLYVYKKSLLSFGRVLDLILLSSKHSIRYKEGGVGCLSSHMDVIQEHTLSRRNSFSPHFFYLGK